jgi:hypothetical protein
VGRLLKWGSFAGSLDALLRGLTCGLHALLNSLTGVL